MKCIITNSHFKFILESEDGLLNKDEKRKNTLKNLIKDQGFEFASNLVGGYKNLIKIISDGDIRKFIRELDIKPYEIKGDTKPNMYISEIIVDMLGLDNFGKEKELGDFRWGPRSSNLPYKMHVRLTPENHKINGINAWRVVGIGGSYGFGYWFINKSEIIGKTYRNQIFKQIIEKFKLDSF